jgi:hypothetical protein
LDALVLVLTAKGAQPPAFTCLSIDVMLGMVEVNALCANAGTSFHERVNHQAQPTHFDSSLDLRARRLKVAQELQEA